MAEQQGRVPLTVLGANKKNSDIQGGNEAAKLAQELNTAFDMSNHDETTQTKPSNSVKPAAQAMEQSITEASTNDLFKDLQQEPVSEEHIETESQPQTTFTDTQQSSTPLFNAEGVQKMAAASQQAIPQIVTPIVEESPRMQSIEADEPTPIINSEDTAQELVSVPEDISIPSVEADEPATTQVNNNIPESIYEQPEVPIPSVEADEPPVTQDDFTPVESTYMKPEVPIPSIEADEPPVMQQNNIQSPIEEQPNMPDNSFAAPAMQYEQIEEPAVVPPMQEVSQPTPIEGQSYQESSSVQPQLTPEQQIFNLVPSEANGQPQQQVINSSGKKKKKKLPLKFIIIGGVGILIVTIILVCLFLFIL